MPENWVGDGDDSVYQLGQLFYTYFEWSRVYKSAHQTSSLSRIDRYGGIENWCVYVCVSGCECMCVFVTERVYVCAF